MDNIIYNYLINNNNNKKEILDTEDDENQIFLDSLLILSINKININYKSLLEYCNNITSITSNNKINNNNNNNKRILENGELYSGLNSYQFQILYKIIKSIKADSSSSSSSSIIVNDHEISKSKFDCSILIIIENNLKLNNKKQQQSKNYNNNNNNKKIKLNNLPSISQQQQQQQQNYDDIYLLFKKVWGNLTIRNEIIFHLRLFNFHMESVNILNFDKYKEYKYRNYLNNVTFYVENDLEKYESVTWTYENHYRYISSSVKHLKILDYYKRFEENSIPSKLNSLVLGGFLNQKLTRNMFNDRIIGGESITELEFGEYFNQSLGGPTDPDNNNNNNNNSSGSEFWLPSNLTSLKFGDAFQQPIYPGQLPKSLKSLIFSSKYQGIISPNSIPKSVTTLDYTFNSNENSKKLNIQSIPSSTTNLIFDNDFNQIIEVGYIPKNVTSLKFGYEFNRIIKHGSLPQSLRSLEFGDCFNQPLINNNKPILPSNLTNLEFGYDFNQSISFGILNLIDSKSGFPESITRLVFGNDFNQTINSNTFKYLQNLKILIIRAENLPQIETGSLPNSITKLDINNYIHPLQPNLLPQSLKSFKYLNKNPIPPHTLPNSITTLSITCCSILRSIPPNPLPNNLKSIFLTLLDDYDLSSIDWPLSLESIYIHNYQNNLNFLSSEFFIKYIKNSLNHKKLIKKLYN